MRSSAALGRLRRSALPLAAGGRGWAEAGRHAPPVPGKQKKKEEKEEKSAKKEKKEKKDKGDKEEKSAKKEKKEKKRSAEEEAAEEPSAKKKKKKDKVGAGGRTGRLHLGGRGFELPSEVVSQAVREVSRKSWAARESRPPVLPSPPRGPTPSAPHALLPSRRASDLRTLTVVIASSVCT
jgi:hypothetical protein